MAHITFGSTGLIIEKMVCGAPDQRVDTETAVKILRRAFEGGINFDTATYSDSRKAGRSFLPECGSGCGATKTMAKTPRTSGRT